MWHKLQLVLSLYLCAKIPCAGKIAQDDKSGKTFQSANNIFFSLVVAKGEILSIF